jgi:hypothetical protein
MLLDVLFLFAVAVPLLLGVIFYLIRPLDRIKPLLEHPMERCDEEGIRSLVGRFRGETVAFTHGPYRPEFFTLTIHCRSRPASGSEWTPPVEVTPSTTPDGSGSTGSFALSEAEHMFRGRQRENLKLLLGSFGFDRLELGQDRIVLHTLNPASGLFSRLRVRSSVLGALDLLAVFHGHRCRDHPADLYPGPVPEHPQHQGENP